MQCFPLPKTCVTVSGRRESCLQFGSNRLWEWTTTFPWDMKTHPLLCPWRAEGDLWERGPLGTGPRSGSPGAAAALQGADDCPEAPLLPVPAPQARVPAQPHSFWAWDCRQWLLASRWPSWLCAGSVYFTELATVDVCEERSPLFYLSVLFLGTAIEGRAMDLSLLSWKEKS